MKTKLEARSKPKMTNITAHQQVTIFRPEGYVSAANANEFLEELTVAIRRKENPIFLLDMNQIEFLDSAGLMALIKGFRLAQGLGRRFSICSISPSVRMIFELTQVDRVLNIFDNYENFEQSIN